MQENISGCFFLLNTVFWWQGFGKWPHWNILAVSFLILYIILLIDTHFLHRTNCIVIVRYSNNFS